MSIKMDGTFQIANLEVVVMPNGKILCSGKVIGRIGKNI